MNDATATELYGPALYLALSNMFGGSGEPSPANYSEFYVQAAMMLVGSSLLGLHNRLSVRHHCDSRSARRGI